MKFPKNRADIETGKEIIMRVRPRRVAAESGIGERLLRIKEGSGWKDGGRMASISVVIPAYDEAERIIPTLKQIW
ncbi:MAG: hypothetical protein AABZ57_00290, partial [Candidatus Margulisiibacteriota bacterium]